MIETINTESAGGIVLNSRGEIALVKNGPHYWGFPKGHVDEGEDVMMAARREIWEEIGVTDLTLLRELPVYGRYKGGEVGGEDRSEYKTIHMYLFTTPEMTLESHDEGNPEARWFAPADVEKTLGLDKDKEYFRSVAGLLGENGEHDLDDGGDRE